ncbi:alpha-L-rhamnosidase [Neotabrizicola shimadae]|nr:alpha-L-rhamnosidase [Neotabrizicola shimadae]
MVAPLADAGVGAQASFVAKDFSLDRVAPGTLLHVSAQGLYRAFVNGTRVGADLLTPGWTCYDDRIAYQSYDVTPLLRAGSNRIEIWLGDGWWRSQMMWAANPIYNCWGDRIAAIVDLEADGIVLLSTDGSWRSGLLPIVKSGIYWGEDRDDRIAPTETAGVEVLAFDTALLVPHEAAGVREMAPLDPQETWADGAATVYDFGQNVGGFVRVTAQGASGATIRVEHSEVLGPNRAFDNRNYRSARAEATYVLKGGPEETFEPIFTFMGFRYARITVTGEAKLLQVQSVPISSVPVLAGGFTCGEPSVNRLVLNTIWSQRGNFIEVPTDCPQRDERLGWTGDAQVFAGTACWLADCERILAKYLRDVRADQRADGAVPHFSPDPTRLHPIENRGDWAGSTGWGDAITVIPWQLYLHYGDVAVLRENFPAMLKWVDYLWSLGNGPIVATDGHWGARGFTFGDWLQPVGDNRKPRPTIADDCAATLYHFISTDLAARIAGILGERAQAEALHNRAEAIRSAFAHEYIAPSGRLAHNDQTSYALAFLHDLVPAHHVEAAKRHFRKIIEDADYLIGTGFIGTPALLPALTKLGMWDLAEKVFLNRDVPGWLYQVDRGATTIWERWDALAPDGTIYAPDMNSYNHYAYGAVCQWLFESVAGLTPDPEGPGLARLRLDPLILPALGHAEAWHDTRHGRIEAGWVLDGHRVTYTVNLPEGVVATLAPNPRHANLSGDGTLGAGRHVMTFDLTD